MPAFLGDVVVVAVLTAIVMSAVQVRTRLLVHGSSRRGRLIRINIGFALVLLSAAAFLVVAIVGHH